MMKFAKQCCLIYKRRGEAWLKPQRTIKPLQCFFGLFHPLKDGPDTIADIGYSRIKRVGLPANR